MIVKLRGNDRKRSMRIRSSDLHYNSRLRMFLEHSKTTKYMCGFSFDVLSSLVATQRHGQILLKGNTTIEELMAELDYDCVTIPCLRFGDTEAEKSVETFARQFVAAIVNWPRLIDAMRINGHPIDYSVGPLHFHLQLVEKPRPTTFQKRPLDLLLMYACHRLMSAHETRFTCTDAFTDEDWVTFETLFPNLKDIYHRITTLSVTSEHGSFWHVAMDEATAGGTNIHSKPTQFDRKCDNMASKIGSIADANV